MRANRPCHRRWGFEPTAERAYSEGNVRPRGGQDVALGRPNQLGCLVVEQTLPVHRTGPEFQIQVVLRSNGRGNLKS